MSDTLEETAERIETLRGEILFGDVGDTLDSGEAEQYFMLGLAALDQAKSFMRLAAIARDKR